VWIILLARKIKELVLVIGSRRSSQPHCGTVKDLAAIFASSQVKTSLQDPKHFNLVQF
jgi:hypothetical protein